MQSARDSPIPVTRKTAENEDDDEDEKDSGVTIKDSKVLEEIAAAGFLASVMSFPIPVRMFRVYDSRSTPYCSPS